ncbi:MAG TPA: sugar transferase [Salinimicrobium sp.]|nr:sugar transferase [Salinimicrobium sp.]
MYQNFFKPVIDFVIAVIGCTVLLPIFIIVFILLFISNKGNPFFIQVRPGKNGRLFNIYKFKTMNDAKDENGILLPDSERLTGMGKLIRKTSLDETPQLLNVLKGEMSLVGPRPLLPEYLELYNDFQKQRHLVRPGITGWAAVNGRNAINWEKKLEYDVYYVKNISFKLDMLIIFKTIKKVIVSEGVNTEGEATTTKFNGTD